MPQSVDIRMRLPRQLVAEDGGALLAATVVGPAAVANRDRRRDEDSGVRDAFDETGVVVVAGGGGEGAVLDAIDASLDGDADALDAVGMGGDAAAQAVGLLDAGAELVDRELGGEGVGSGRHVAAGGHDLDPVGAGLHAFADGLADTELAIAFAAHEPAVAACGGDRGAGDEQAGTLDEPGRDAVAKFDGERRGRAEVANGGDTRFEHAAAVASHPEQHALRRVAIEGRPPPGGRVKTEVRVALDEPGDDRAAGDVEGAGGAEVRAASLDAVAVDGDVGLDGGVCEAVPCATAADDEGAHAAGFYADVAGWCG